MEHRDKPGEQILIGILRGTSLLHFLPVEISDIFSQIKEKEKSSLLEKISMGVTTLTEGAIYYLLTKRGIPAYYLLIATNTIGSAVLGVVRYFNRFEDTMYHTTPGPSVVAFSDLISQQHFASSRAPIKKSLIVPEQLDLPYTK